MTTVPIFLLPHQPYRSIHQPERRQTTPQQGRALEALGHAIEYLVDSRLDDCREAATDAMAVHVLMVCSRAVFSECERTVPWRQRVEKALKRRMRWKVRMRLPLSH